MLEFITSIPHKISEHFATMTTFILVATIIKVSIPIINYIVTRISEYRTYKRWLKIPGMTEEQARKDARDIWRPKSKPPNLLLKIKNKLFPPKK